MSTREFDIARAKLLVDEISANLAGLPADTVRYAELRAEVDALKAMLDRSGAQEEHVRDSLKTVHGLFDRTAAELQAEGVRAGTFVHE